MNWKNLIAELIALGLTQSQIAARCKCGQTTVSELANGISSEPRHGLGQKLIACLKKMQKSQKRTARQTVAQPSA